MKKIKKILVSQPRPQTERNPYSDMDSTYGVECDFQQLICKFIYYILYL